MLFILGFPMLNVKGVEASEVAAQDSQDETQEARIPLSSNVHRTIDLSVHWRVETLLSPQDVSLMIRWDSDESTVTLRLQNNSGDSRFIWQDWLDSAMGYMKGFEVALDGSNGYDRKITRAELGKPMVELSPLLVDDYDAEVEKQGTARVWMGWPPFDPRICKFEVDQWLDACNLDIRTCSVSDELASFKDVINAMIMDR